MADNGSLYEILKKLAIDDAAVGSLAAGGYSGSSASAVNVTNSTWTRLMQFTLDPGVYIVKAMASFPSGSTGTRVINIGTSSGASTDVVWNTAKQNAAASNATQVHLITFLSVESTTTYYFNAHQNSGGTLSVTPRLGVICLKTAETVNNQRSGTLSLPNRSPISGETLEGESSTASLRSVSLPTDDTKYNIIASRLGLPLITDSEESDISESTLYDVLTELSNESFYASGEGLTLSSVVLSGISNAMSARFTIPVAKSLANITRISVNECKGGVFIPTGGYLNGVGETTEWSNQSGITVSAEKAGDYYITLKIESASGFANISNGIPCNMLTNPVVLSFS